MVFHNQRFDNTHDLEVLIDSAATFNPDFSQYIETSARLTPYAVTFRYPGIDFEPDPEEFAQALRIAEEFYSFVLSLLPEPSILSPHILRQNFPHNSL